MCLQRNPWWPRRERRGSRWQSFVYVPERGRGAVTMSDDDRKFQVRIKMVPMPLLVGSDKVALDDRREPFLLQNDGVWWDRGHQTSCRLCHAGRHCMHQCWMASREPVPGGMCGTGAKHVRDCIEVIKSIENVTIQADAMVIRAPQARYPAATQ